ncbi:MAG: biopolymer transporter ExbD [Bacteroidota bacterium]|nr:biopolymer transporter ExbD [Bacteroidota bacterium]MDX5431631.1 biopolymer transporter ExbD [Bacteroidota bacterium]MDX5470349.1 biopolymer transporter ExbD [Bacteroidota bacterium]
MARKSRALPEINAGSMADIAFLLLIFFLVTTTMDSDSGISIKLPPWEENITEPPPPIKARNVLEVLVNSNNQLLVEGEVIRVNQLRDKTKKFITNEGLDPNMSVSPEKAVISLKNDRGTNYVTYISVQNELKAAYREVRDEYARQKYGRKYDDLSEKQQDEVKEKYPQKISEAEPENIGGAE